MNKQRLFYIGIAIAGIAIGITGLNKAEAYEWTAQDRTHLQSLYQAGDRDGIKNHLRRFHAKRVDWRGGFTVEQTLRLHRNNDVEIQRRR